MEAVQVHPRDIHNQNLLKNVHPSDWVSPEPSGRYNLVVIGAGTAGLISAKGAAGLGAKVALIERELLGGDCLNVGCVPSKALIRSARAFAAVRDAGEYGVVVPAGAAVDFPAVMERMRRLRASISPVDSAASCRDAGVDVFLGQARFSGRDRVEVGGKTLCFKKAVIATGARAVRPRIPGLAEAGFLTNETVFSLTELPRRLVVIGAGPIGCELAQAFARFGAEVHLVAIHEQIMPKEDIDAARIVEGSLLKDGVRLCLETEVESVRRDGADKVVVLKSRGRTEELRVDEILAGAGRAPNVQGLGLEAAGVEYDEREGVKVDDRLQTSNPRIYAAGDICSRFKFTHAADAMARIVLQNALFLGRARASALTMPWCTYTDPEVAHVGLYEDDARAQGIEFNALTQELSHVDRAILDGASEGFVKVLVKKGSDKIVGATIVAEHAGEMVSEITTAIAGGIGLGKLSKVIHPYPTQAEAIKRVADAYNRTRLTPFVKGLFQRWLSWTR
jgi:pyruvate/2-oxoglutarate dehydrogenase complex dihydrolipoamide dehydrogenase (E3) component